jgi:hypothetical protein
VLILWPLSNFSHPKISLGFEFLLCMFLLHLIL